MTKALVKDLRVIKNINMNETLLVEDSVSNCMNQLPNAVPILPFQGNLEDMELLGLAKYLLAIKDQKDIVASNANYFQFAKLKGCETMERALDKLQGKD